MYLAVKCVRGARTAAGMDEYVNASDPRDQFMFMLFDRLSAHEAQVARLQAEVAELQTWKSKRESMDRIVSIPAGDWLVYNVYIDRGAELDIMSVLDKVQLPKGMVVVYNHHGAVFNIEGALCTSWSVSMRSKKSVPIIDDRSDLTMRLLHESDARIQNGRVRRMQTFSLPIDIAWNTGMKTFET